MNHKLSPLTRIITVFSALILIVVLFVPIWRIELSAPQYPEGLALQIHADKLAGDVDVINGLNHYIGMRTLHTDDFVEFQVLPYIIGILAAFGLIAALVNRKWFFMTWGGFFVLFCIISMVDFYRWNYNYGHNLDPAAAIRVPGMAYQPPLIGYKQLLNFGAYSIPDIGGWIMTVVGLLIAFGFYMEIRNYRKRNTSISRYSGAIILCLFLASCSSGPRPIQMGKDNCTFCKMTITDLRFASELVTDKGKIFVFDDINCIHSYISAEALEPDRYTLYFIDFTSEELIKQDVAHYLRSEELRSPMGSNIAVFQSEDSVNVYKDRLGGEIISWDRSSQ